MNDEYDAICDNCDFELDEVDVGPMTQEEYQRQLQGIKDAARRVK